MHAVVIAYVDLIVCLLVFLSVFLQAQVPIFSSYLQEIEVNTCLAPRLYVSRMISLS